MLKVIIGATVLSLIITVILMLSSSYTNRVIQVSLQHDSVNVINGNKEVEVYGSEEFISFTLRGAIKDTNVHSLKLRLLHKERNAGVFPMSVNSKGKFTLPLLFSLDDLNNHKEYKFILELPDNEYIDSGSIQLSVLAEVYGKNGFSASIILAIGTFASLLQIIQLFYPDHSKKRTIKHNSRSPLVSVTANSHGD